MIFAEVVSEVGSEVDLVDRVYFYKRFGYKGKENKKALIRREGGVRGGIFFRYEYD